MTTYKDTDLREALRRKYTDTPQLPADFMQRLHQSGEKNTKRPIHRWLYPVSAIAAAASIALFIIFHFGKEQTPQEPLVAQTIEKTTSQPTPTVSVPEQAEGEPVEGVEGEPSSTVPEPVEGPKSVKKQRKVVTKLVELIPTSEAKSDNMKELPASLIAKVKAYEQESDPSRTTGIDDGTDAIVTTTMDIDEDPLVAMASQVKDIRQRGQRLEREIELRMDN